MPTTTFLAVILFLFIYRFMLDIWLHIRCAGGWTNKLYDHYKHFQTKTEEQKCVSNQSDQESIVPTRRRLQSENNQDITLRHRRLRKMSANSQQSVGVLNNRGTVREPTTFFNAARSNHANGKNIPTPRVIFAPETLTEKVFL